MWTCPSCGRRVPGRVSECRCGFRASDTPPAPSSDAPQQDEAPSSHGVLILLTVVLVATALLLLYRGIQAPATRTGSVPMRTNTPPAAVGDSGPAAGARPAC